MDAQLKEKYNGYEDLRNKQSCTDEELDKVSWKFWRKRRYMVVVFIFFGLFNLNTLKTSVTVSIVAMTENRTILHDDGHITYEQEFSYDSMEKGRILGCYFYGYIFTQFIGGYLATKFKGTKIFSTAIGICSILTMLTPIAAKCGFQYFMLVRIVSGTCAGATIPCIFKMYSNWIPPNERARMSGIGYSGFTLGNLLCIGLSGILAANIGWESIYYIFGSVSMIWYILFVIMIRENPSNDPFITNDEKRYLEQSIGHIPNVGLLDMPWKAILKTPCLYSLLVGIFAENWGLLTILLHLPLFVRDTISTNLQKSGFLSAFPYLIYAICLPLGGYIGDRIIMTGYLTVSQTRKYLTCGGFLAQIIFGLLVAYVDNTIGVITCLTLAISLGAFPYTSMSANLLEVSRQYSSMLLGLINTFSSVSGLLTSIITGYIVQNRTKEEWRIVFYIMSGIYLFSTIVFWLFSSSELQSWAIPTENRETKKSENEKTLTKLI